MYKVFTFPLFSWINGKSNMNVEAYTMTPNFMQYKYICTIVFFFYLTKLFHFCVLNLNFYIIIMIILFKTCLCGNIVVSDHLHFYIQIYTSDKILICCFEFIYNYYHVNY